MTCSHMERMLPMFNRRLKVVVMGGGSGKEKLVVPGIHQYGELGNETLDVRHAWLHSSLTLSPCYGAPAR